MVVTTNSAPAAHTPQDALHALLCEVLPPQGAWSDDAYLWFTDHSNRLIEFTDGQVLRDRTDPRCQDRYWLGADLVAEVVSPDNPDRDLVEKRVDYAEAGIPEYWIADLRDETIRVLTLQGAAYVEHGVYGRGSMAMSPLLAGFAAEVSAVFDAPTVGV